MLLAWYGLLQEEKRLRSFNRVGKLLLPVVQWGKDTNCRVLFDNSPLLCLGLQNVL